jgi:cell division inhibitor SepF
MASAMRKMAVYLGLVEDDHRYQDKYDSYGEYEDFDDQADRPEQADEPDVRSGRDDYVGYQPADTASSHLQ